MGSMSIDVVIPGFRQWKRGGIKLAFLIVEEIMA